MSMTAKYKPYKRKRFGKVELRLADGRVYLRRWYFIRIYRLFSIRLHHFLLPDLQLEPHDHPYSFFSIVLKGGYWELWAKRQAVEFVFKAMKHGVMGPSIFCAPPRELGYPFVYKEVKRFSFHRNSDLHRVMSFRRGDRIKGGSWSLVITGPDSGEWGFWTREGYVPHEKLGTGGVL